MQNIESPLTKSNDTTFQKSITAKSIINAYKTFAIDVAPYFHSLKKISIYKCNQTGYMFYYPLQLAGDSKFYEHFQKFDWYYMPWKWEHEITFKYIQSNNTILEVGCAHGAFINKINEQVELKYSIGLELNETASRKESKWEIINETVQSFSEKNSEKFDLVCSFQVLEHIADVNSFLNAKIKCVKKGGLLIISVPNNDSFLKYQNNCLNMPPHHMGLWNQISLENLETLFPLKLKKMHFEELQSYHVSSYIYSKHYSKYPRLLGKILLKLTKFSGRYKRLYIKTEANQHNLRGQTILAVYEKL